ncbi:MAG: hypothetical protein JNN20_03915 [Betaproteobacteria bacterium]|nr:hypothetical protein [Betaproteobacteria bacterium]
MKKKTTYSSPRAFKFEGTNLYLHDIRHLCDEAAKRGLEIHIGDEQYEYDSIDEVKQEKGDVIRSIRIWFKDPSSLETLRLELGVGEWEVRCGRSDVLAGLQAIVINTLADRQPWFAKWPSILPTLGISSTAILLSEFALKSWPATSRTLIVAAAIFFLISSICQFARLLNGRLKLKREHEEQSWYERNGEKLLYGFVGAVLGQAGKTIFDVLTSR